MDFITSLRIGTIHSFCESVIRKHATEVGISPGFTILDEDQATMLAGSVIEDFINELAHEPSLDIFDNFRKKDLKDLFKSFLMMRQINEVNEISFEDYVKQSKLCPRHYSARRYRDAAVASDGSPRGRVYRNDHTEYSELSFCRSQR